MRLGWSPTFTTPTSPAHRTSPMQHRLCGAGLQFPVRRCGGGEGVVVAVAVAVAVVVVVVVVAAAV
eukprot:85837-Pyramimonas_sp.AAC.1